MMFEYLKLLLVPIVLSAIAVAWVQFSGQTKILRSFKNYVIIVLKSFLVSVLLVYFLCRMCGCSVDFVLSRCLPVVLVMLLAARYETPFSDSDIASALIGAVLFPFYLAKQYVLGFPDKDDWFLEPPDRSQADREKEVQENKLIGRRGVVSASLRPMGEVEIDEARYAAKSDTGDLVDKGVDVVVIERQSGYLIVESCEDES